jgi:hypothetical protein
MVPRVPWSQCNAPQRELCQREAGANAEFQACMQAAKKADKADPNAELRERIGAYEKAAEQLDEVVSALQNPELFLKSTLPARVFTKFNSIMSDLFGPDGEIRADKSEIVEEYYDIALPLTEQAQRLTIREPFVL